MSENEIAFNPDPPRRTEHQSIRDVRAEPRHQMRPFVDRHEPAVENLYRRGHLLPSERGYETPPHPRAQNPDFASNISKPSTSTPLPSDHNDPQSTS